MNGEIVARIVEAVVLFIFGGGLMKLYGDWRAAKREKRLEPVAEGTAITQLADALTDAAKKSVDNMREEVAEARAELAKARDELHAQAEQAVERENYHAAVLARMRRRIAQLAKVLADNHLDVPDEDDESLVEVAI